MKKNAYTPLRLASLVLSLLLFAFPIPCAAASAVPPVTTAPQDGGANTPMTLPAAAGEQMLLPGGMPFGVRMQTKGVLVVGLCDVTEQGKAHRPAYDGGVRVGDVLVVIHSTPSVS